MSQNEKLSKCIWRRNSAAQNAMSNIRELLKIYTHNGEMRTDLHQVVIWNSYTTRLLLKYIHEYCFEVYSTFPSIPFEVDYIEKMYLDFIDQGDFLDDLDEDDVCVISPYDLILMIKAVRRINEDLLKIVHGS